MGKRTKPATHIENRHAWLEVDFAADKIKLVLLCFVERCRIFPVCTGIHHPFIKHGPVEIVPDIVVLFGDSSRSDPVLQIEKSRFEWRGLPGAALAFMRYILILAYDLIVSGFQVARIVLSKSMPIRQGLSKLPTGVKSEMGAALSAHAITLTPGELVIEMDDEGSLYTHCLDATPSGEYIREAQEMREELLDKIMP